MGRYIPEASATTGLNRGIAMSASLRLEGVAVKYGKALAVDGVSMEVDQHSTSVVLGANGAGKTSLLRGVSGFERWEDGHLSAGSVFLDGVDTSKWSPRRKVELGIALVPERQGVFLPLTVEENLRLVISRAKKKAQFRPIMDTIEDLFPVLGKRKGQYAGLLSGGERQMLSISMRLLMSPRFLLIDEISLGLAPGIILQMFDALKEVRSRFNVGLVIVEQNVEASLSVADKVYLLQNGRIVRAGTASEFRDDLGSLEAAYIGGSLE